MTIEREQWADWKEHPVTQEMIKILRELREFGFDEVAYGADDDELVRLGIKLGKLNALTAIINFTFIPEKEEEHGRSAED